MPFTRGLPPDARRAEEQRQLNVTGALAANRAANMVRVPPPPPANAPPPPGAMGMAGPMPPPPMLPGGTGTLSPSLGAAPAPLSVPPPPPAPPMMSAAPPMAGPAPMPMGAPMPMQPLMPAAGAPLPRFAQGGMMQTPAPMAGEDRGLLPGVIPYEALVAAGVQQATTGSVDPSQFADLLPEGVDLGVMGGAAAPDATAAYDGATGGEYTPAPQPFVRWLEATRPENTNEMGRNLLAAFANDPTSAPRLWDAVQAIAEEMPEQLPNDLRALVKRPNAEPPPPVPSVAAREGGPPARDDVPAPPRKKRRR